MPLSLGFRHLELLMLVTETAEDAGCKARLAQLAGGALILDASAAAAPEVSADWTASVFKR